MSTSNLNIPARSRQAIPDLLDLSSLYTHSLSEQWLPAAGVNLSALPAGVKAYAKSAFDLRGVIHLGGLDVDGPDSVEIPVGMKGRKFHFLQGMYGQAALQETVAAWMIRYANGEHREIPLSCGYNVRPLDDAQTGPLVHGEVVVLEPNADGRQVQLARYAFNNPLPEVTVETITLVPVKRDVIPFVAGITLERNDPVYEWFDAIKVGDYNPILPRSCEATPDQVDLTGFYGASLDDDWFNHSSHDLHDVPKGIQSMAGTKFDVRGLIVLGGSHSMEITGLALPEAVCGIPVNRAGKRIHFLQACGFSAPHGTKVGEYVIHYANGETRVVPILYGVHTVDWWLSDIVTEARIAWIGSHAAARLQGLQTRLVKQTWENDLPEVTVTAIDFVSALADPAPFLVAITVDAE
jgi:hypothetical protein